MLTIIVATPFRKRQRRHRRLPVGLTRERRPAGLRRTAPLPPHAVAAPDAPWPATDDLYVDLDQATWEDAEWR